MSLKFNPQRGRLEEDLAGFNKEFRTIIYYITKRTLLKLFILLMRSQKQSMLLISSIPKKTLIQKQNEVKINTESCTKNYNR
ncbi:hypothetical protein ACSSV5_002120 [Psychroflexus sp. MBR-150]|jgi:hypothetical protein